MPDMVFDPLTAAIECVSKANGMELRYAEIKVQESIAWSLIGILQTMQCEHHRKWAGDVPPTKERPSGTPAIPTEEHDGSHPDQPVVS